MIKWFKNLFNKNVKPSPKLLKLQKKYKQGHIAIFKPSNDIVRLGNIYEDGTDYVIEISINDRFFLVDLDDLTLDKKPYKIGFKY